MTQMGKILVIAGLALTVLGLAVWALGKVGFRGLPGDIRYESENVKVYFPIVACLVLSALLTGIGWLVAILRHRWRQ